MLQRTLVGSWKGFNRQEICPELKFQKAQLSSLKETLGRVRWMKISARRQLDFVTQDPDSFIFIIWGFIRPFSCRDIVYFEHTSLRLHFSLLPTCSLRLLDSFAFHFLSSVYACFYVFILPGTVELFPFPLDLLFLMWSCFFFSAVTLASFTSKYCCLP